MICEPMEATKTQLHQPAPQELSGSEASRLVLRMPVHTVEIRIYYSYLKPRQAITL